MSQERGCSTGEAACLLPVATSMSRVDPASVQEISARVGEGSHQRNFARQESSSRTGEKSDARSTWAALPVNTASRVPSRLAARKGLEACRKSADCSSPPGTVKEPNRPEASNAATPDGKPTNATGATSPTLRGDSLAERITHSSGRGPCAAESHKSPAKSKAAPVTPPNERRTPAGRGPPSAAGAPLSQTATELAP